MGVAGDSSPKKRKRDDIDKSDPKLQEFLEVMGHPSKKSKDQGNQSGALRTGRSPSPPAVVEAGKSDDEYEDIPVRVSTSDLRTAAISEDVSENLRVNIDPPVKHTRDVADGETQQVGMAGTDDDWLRSKTSRLLDLVDPDDPGFPARLRGTASMNPPSVVEVSTPVTTEEAQGKLSDVMDEPQERPGRAASSEDTADLIRETSRLFLRNLSYTTTEDDIRDHFSSFGHLDEVRKVPSTFPTTTFNDEPLIGTSYAISI